MFSSTASHGQRWNVPAGCWLSDGTRRSHLLVDCDHLTPRVPQTHTNVFDRHLRSIFRLDTSGVILRALSVSER